MARSSPAYMAMVKKGGVQVGAAGQTEADIGYAQHGAHSQLLFAGFQCLHRGQHILLLGAGGQGKAVNVDILPGNAALPAPPR